MRRPKRTRVRAVAGVAALATVFALAGPARAQDIPEQLQVARGRVHALEARINASENELSQSKERLASLEKLVVSQSASLTETRQRLDTTTRRLDATKASLQSLHDRMRDRARNVYMRGPTSLIDVVLGAKTLVQFEARVTYAAAIAKQDSNLMYQVRKLKAEVTRQRDTQRSLERRQASEYSSLKAKQLSVQSTLVETLTTVDELAHERAQAQMMVFQLADKLGAELFGLKQVAGHGMTITYGEWATSFLNNLGAPVSRNNLVVMVAWQTAEGTLATWNPLATTHDMPGATVYNSSRVRNYVSRQQGVDASIATLNVPNHGYGEIVSGLKSSADPMDTGNAIQASDWCHGCSGGAYVVGIIPAVQQYYDQYSG